MRFCCTGLCSAQDQASKGKKSFVLVGLDAKGISADLLTSDMMGGLNNGYNA